MTRGRCRAAAMVQGAWSACQVHTDTTSSPLGREHLLGIHVVIGGQPEGGIHLVHGGRLRVGQRDDVETLVGTVAAHMVMGYATTPDDAHP